MNRFSIIHTPLEGLTLLQRHRQEDERGFLSRLYCAEELASAGLPLPIAQINHTLTRRKGTVRGMHFQTSPCSEAKLITCLKGEVFDVAVDIRQNSPTFLQWHGEILSPSNLRSVLIPIGFAHGFQALTDDCELIYLHTSSYQPQSEASLNACDPRLAISWPLTITERSDRDRNQALVEADFKGFLA